MMAQLVDVCRSQDAITAAGQPASPIFLRLLNASRVAVNALLSGSSTTSGFLVPRLTTTERDAIASPTAGETIFNTTVGRGQMYDGAAWNSLW